jgi:hypothetical protein
VSLPNLDRSPDENYISAETGYGNPQGTLFIGLWPGNKVYFYPGGPGTIGPDGSLGMKFWFYRTVPGEVVFGGQRLDAPAPPMPATVLRGKEDGYGETGFHPAGLVFSSEGCWEVAASVGNERLTFVTLVAYVPFEPLWPNWLPEGLAYQDADFTGLPGSFRFVFGSADGSAGAVSVETAQGGLESAQPYPDAEQQPLTVNGQSGVCVRAGADAGALEWSEGGLSYRIRQDGLGLRCEDLLRIASRAE